MSISWKLNQSLKSVCLFYVVCLYSKVWRPQPVQFNCSSLRIFKGNVDNNVSNAEEDFAYAAFINY